MNKILHAERAKFFQRLKAARVARSTYETTAAVVIQAAVRGYVVRKHMSRIYATCLTTNDWRLRLRRIVSANSDYIVPKLSAYRNTYKEKRFHSALAIQCAFRSFVSKRFLQRKRVESKLQSVSRGILRIQCCGRKYNAKKRVDVIRERKMIALRLRAVVRIQTVARKKLATNRMKRRRYMFQWLAARMIQGFYRYVYSKRTAQGKRAGMAQRRRQRGALAMQQAARAYMSRLRTGRIRDRKNYVRRFKAVTKIVSVVRSFLCRGRVAKIRVIKEKEREDAAQQLQEELARKAAEENRALLQDSDIFVQTREGNATEVDDIFTGLMSDEPHETTEVDDFGDTVLLIASSLGHMEIVRKCLIWGFDINFRNDMTGYSAVALAAQNKHFDVVQYLLNPPALKSTKGSAAAPSIVWSPDDVAVVLTAVAHHSKNVSLMSTLIETLGPGALSTKHADTGETSFHAAFRGGYVEMVNLLLKFAVEDVYETKDESGKTLYHCASESSVELLNLLKELDPSLSPKQGESVEGGTEVSKDEALLKKLRQKEDNGKSCLLIAALYGQGEVLKLAKELESSDSTEDSEQDGEVEIGWSPADIEAAIKTAEKGEVSCIRFLIEAGFDPSWANDDTGKSIVMVSCQAGQLKVLDSIMMTGTSFAETDVNGRTPIHYACMCSTENVLSFLLSHGAANKCNINGMSLAIEDRNGLTPLHVAAEHGCNLSVDLLAQDGIAVAINKRSTAAGMTPLMTAAAKGKTEVLSRLMVLDADSKLLDNAGHNALWHLLQCKSDDKGTAPSRLGVSSAGLELVRAGCPIISTHARSLEEWRTRKELIVAGKIKREDLEVIELLAVDKNTSFMRSLAKCLDPDSCWEAGKFALINVVVIFLIVGVMLTIVLAAIAFDGPESTLYNALMAGGADEVMLKVGNARYLSSSGGDAPRGAAPRIMDIMYKGYTLHGWAIVFSNVGLLMKFLDKFPLSNVPLDLDGNTAFHIAARYGSPDMVDAVLGYAHVIVEALNNKGNTALMEGMQCGDFKTQLRIAKAVADPRRGLERRYDAWLLAIARQRELNEKNLQTGQIQDDDENVCPMAPDPDYLFWYEYK